MPLMRCSEKRKGNLNQAEKRELAALVKHDSAAALGMRDGTSQSTLAPIGLAATFISATRPASVAMHHKTRDA
jgi:hypothetical protein